MINLGLPYIRGYLPRGNYQAALATEIQRRLEADPSLLTQIMPRISRSDGGGPLQLTDAPPTRARTRAGRHVDYGKLQEESRRVGALGEELVVDYERKRLRDAGRPDLAEDVQWVARDIGDGLGYDVLSFELSGEELYHRGKVHQPGRRDSLLHLLSRTRLRAPSRSDLRPVSGIAGR